MTSINDVRLVGRLTKAPEFDETSTKKSFARLSVETETFIRVSGERRRIANTHTVICYNQFSLPVLRAVKAGQRVKVLGELAYDRSGKAEIRVLQYSGEVGLMDGPPEASGSTEAAQTTPQATNSKPSGGLGRLPQSRPSHDPSPEPAVRRESYDEDLEADEIPF